MSLFDFDTLSRERVTKQCVCCGSTSITASPAILMPFVAERVFGWKPVEIDASWGLRTVPEGRAYAVCNSLHCQECGHLFCDLRFSDAEMSALYDGYREADYTRLRDQYEPGYAARNKGLNEAVSYLPQVEAFLRPLVQEPLTILDWGGDTGKNTPFKTENAGLHIFDISNKEVEQGARMVSLEEATGTKYRLVVCSMVLEHVAYPSDVLLQARKALDEGSILYIEVPYEDVARAEMPDLSRHKRHWHEHINFYSRRSLSRLIENCGLSIVAQNVLVTEVAGSSVHVMQVACRLNVNAG